MLRHALLATEQQDGGGAPVALESALRDAAPDLLADLLPRPRSATELAKLQDPAFEHCGHRLEPLGRQVVLQLSEDLGVSELACWDLVHRTAGAEVCRGVLRQRECREVAVLCPQRALAVG